MSQLKPVHESIVPARISAGADLSAMEANDRFVLDCIDGVSSAEELAFLLGMSFEDTTQALQRLQQLAIIDWEAAEVSAESDEGQVPASVAEELLGAADDLFAPSTAVELGAEAEARAPAAATSSADDTVPVDVLTPKELAPAKASVSSGIDEDYQALADEISAVSRGQATVDYSVGDLLTQMTNSTVSVQAVRDEITRPAGAEAVAAAIEASETGLRSLEQELQELPDDASPALSVQPPSRRETSDPALALTPAVPLDIVDSERAGFAVRSSAQAPPPLPARAQDRIPTSNHPAIPAPPADKSSWKRSAAESRGAGPETPRRHLDTSWWGSQRASAEPDEVLTAREVSVSGPMPTPSEPSTTSGSTTQNSTELRPTLSQTPQRLERPPGGFLHARSVTGEVTSETQRVLIDARGAITAEVEAVEADESVVDEVAHARGAAAPLLPELEADEGFEETLQMSRPLSGVFAMETELPILSPVELSPWAEEPVRASLKGANGGWDEERARCISWYLRIVQGGTYYELLGIADNASVDVVVQAARKLRTSLDLGGLSQRADASGLEAIGVVDKGIARALDVLTNPEARTSYDAALAALAAFKV